MAKGLRSTAKLAHRNAKRRDEKSDYRVIEAARMNAIQQRLQAGLAAPRMEVYSVADIETAEAKNKAQQQVNGDDSAAAATAPEDEQMQTEDGQTQAPKKISTSGPRDNARTRWKKARAKGKPSKKGGRR